MKLKLFMNKIDSMGGAVHHPFFFVDYDFIKFYSNGPRLHVCSNFPGPGRDKFLKSFSKKKS